MSTYHPLNSEGRQLDATFEVMVAADEIAVVLHHSAGARGTAAAVNTDYAPALELLLARLGELDVRISRISVDSSVALAFAVQDRIVPLPYPITLGRCDVAELRIGITEGMRAVARRPGAKPGGGNNRKRIRIVITGARIPSAPHRIASHLVGPSPNACKGGAAAT